MKASTYKVLISYRNGAGIHTEYTTSVLAADKADAMKAAKRIVAQRFTWVDSAVVAQVTRVRGDRGSK